MVACRRKKVTFAGQHPKRLIFPRNSLASPVTIKTFFQEDPGMRELGGVSYLAKLAASAISFYASTDYANLISELALRRNLIKLGQEISEKASVMAVPKTKSRIKGKSGGKMTPEAT